MRVEVLGGVERRRRWSSDEKTRIVEETLVPGAKISEVARRNGISASLVFTWRRQARTGASPAAIAPRFAAVRIAGPDTGAAISKPSAEELTQSRPAASGRSGLIEISLGGDASVRIDRPDHPAKRIGVSYQNADAAVRVASCQALLAERTQF